MSEETIINIEKYRFRIKENISNNRDGIIYSYNFKIGGNYSDCVNVSVSYDTNGKPIMAKIPTLVYDSECSLTEPLDKGEGTIVMIKTLLRHIKNKVPEINEFVFEDKSNIECGTEDEQYRKRYRKRGTHTVPVALYYFSLAFNGITWYEKHFNAYQLDSAIHKEYRKKVKELLTDKNQKPSFNEFLCIAQPPTKYLNELQSLYEKADTYGQFFKSIPKNDRCRLVREWISTFMEHYLKGVFKCTDWVIDVRKMDDKVIINQNGGNGTRKKGKSTKSSYYCPKGKIRLSFEQKDTGA